MTTWWQRRTWKAWKAGKCWTTGSKGKTGISNPKSSWSQGENRVKGRNWRIHFTSHSSDLPDESNSHRKSKCRVPVFCHPKRTVTCRKRRLEARQVTLDDAGEWTCVGRNVLGRAGHQTTRWQFQNRTTGAKLGNTIRPYRGSTIPSSLQPIMPCLICLLLQNYFT